MSTYSPQTLGWWMDERRGELALTWQQVADEAVAATETLYRIAGGRRMRTTTKKGLERALRWTAGSIDAVQRGLEPVPLPTAPAPPPPVDLETGGPGDLQRELEYFHKRLRETPGDFDRLMDLLRLYANIYRNSADSTQSSARNDAQG